jgi:phenylpyruvate tautomerase PptA (4-oxalocrotonate tautomerase family)
MKIFFLTEMVSGCFKWRAAVPAKYLRRRGHEIQLFANGVEAYEAPDILVIRTHYPGVEPLIAWCKSKAIRVVYDTDDALDLVPKENLNYWNLQKKIKDYHFLLENADVVTTTTAVLANHLRQRNPNVVVLPNSVDPEMWTVAPRSTQLRVGWTGSATHFHDLQVALDAIREAQKKYPFTFVLQGLCEQQDPRLFYDALAAHYDKAFLDSTLGKAMKHFLDKLARMSYEFHPMVSVDRHGQQVCDLALDIGIAPLVNDRFNSHKSCVKYYEYAMSGAVTLASHVVPYCEEVPITAKNNRQSWINKLEMLLTSDRQRLWKHERDWVLSYRNIERNVANWEQVYRGELPDQSASSVQDELLEAAN